MIVICGDWSSRSRTLWQEFFKCSSKIEFQKELEAHFHQADARLLRSGLNTKLGCKPKSGTNCGNFCIFTRWAQCSSLPFQLRHIPPSPTGSVPYISMARFKSACIQVNPRKAAGMDGIPGQSTGPSHHWHLQPHPSFHSRRNVKRPISMSTKQ